MTRFFLRTLGRLSLHRERPDGDEIMADAKILALLAYLEDTPEGTGDRTHLARLLWPEVELSRARAGLRQALYYLRRKVPDEATLIRSDQERIALDRRHLGSDFRELRDARSRGDWEEVISLYRGPFLGGFSVRGAEEFRLWRDSRDDGIRAVVREACKCLVSEGLSQDDTSRALRGARRWVDLNPLDEEAQAALIRSLVAAGDRAGAFEAYEAYRTQLREELGESPGPTLARSLEELRSLAADELEAPAARETATHPTPESHERDRETERARGDGTEVSPLGPGRWRVVAGVGVALVAILLVGVGWRMLAGESGVSTGSGEGTTGRMTEIVVQTGSLGETASVHTVRWFDDSAAVVPREGWVEGSLPGPRGERVVTRERGASGIDLYVSPVGSDDRAPLAVSDADESPVAWSPDGERLLYRAGRREGDGTYRRRFRIARVRAGRVDSLHLFTTEDMMDPGHEGAWSPLGTSVAVVSDSAGNPDVWLLRPDGSSLRNLTPDHGGFDGEPAFSPAGSRLAFVSDRGGSLGIWTVFADGGTPTLLADSRAPERGPVWLDSRTVGFFRVLPDRTEFRVVGVAGGESRVAATLPDYRRNVAVVRPGGRRGWIASVELPQRLRRVSPGQWIQREVVLRDPAGRAIPSTGVPMDWSVSDSTVADLSSEGWIRVVGEGEALVSASAGGWRGDTLTVRSRSPEVAELSAALEEDWLAGLDTTVWVPVGDPLPVVVDAPGRFRQAFLSRGDENYSSGAVTRSRFRATDGLTVEVWGRVPYTTGPHQAFQLALLPVLPEVGSATGVDGEKRELPLRMHVAMPDSLELFGSDGVARVPAPDPLDRWHRYTIQVDTAGRATFLVDGRVHWRWPEPVDLERLDGVHLALYGRSMGTRILHGPVTVWEGVRYRLP